MTPTEIVSTKVSGSSASADPQQQGESLGQATDLWGWLRLWERPVLDLVLAGCICAAALGYWLWSEPSPAVVPAPAAALTAPSAGVAPTAPDPRRIVSSQLNNQGMQFYQAADYAGAEALFRKAIAADPADALGYCNLGAALIPQRRYDEAIAALQRSLALDPSFTLAQNNLRWALQEKDKARNAK
jgi:tetratricopeptide (TPR) repeat protein